MSRSRKGMGWNDENTASSTLPPLHDQQQQQQSQKLLRFREPAQEAEPGNNRNRRTSMLPTLQRRNSLLAFEPTVAKFVKNGDRFFEGVQVNISPRVIRSWEVLLAELSHRIDLPAGVRKIYTPEHGHRVNSLSELQHHKVYVCASTEPFKKIDYKKVKNPDWKTTKARQSQTVRPSVFSKTYPLVPVDLGASFKSIASIGGSDGLDNSSKSKRIPRLRRLSRPMRLSNISEPDALTSFTVPSPNAASNRPLSPIIDNARPTGITVYQNGPPPRYSVLVYLNREAIRSWEDAKKLIGENLPNQNGLLRLYKPDGEEVQSLSQLWRAGSMLIAAGKEKFDIADFMAGGGGERVDLLDLKKWYLHLVFSVW